MHVCKGDLLIIEFLISKNKNIEAKDKFENTPLHDSCYNGYLNVDEYLISKRSKYRSKIF